MNVTFEFKCIGCSSRQEISIDALLCSSCGQPYEIKYHFPPDPFSPRLPYVGDGYSVSLGEGRTPESQLRRLAKKFGLSKIWAKLEYAAPTGSFKDRGTAVMVRAAIEFGVKECVEDSSGNAGASLAAYAAAAGIKVHVFIPSSAPLGKKDQIRIYGACLHEVDGPRQAATHNASEFVADRGLVFLSHSLSPFYPEGMKSFAYEVLKDPDRRVDHIIFPVGNGSLIIGAFAGFKELSVSRNDLQVPKLHCVQSEASSPIVAAIHNESWNPRSKSSTVATGISVATPPRLQQVVESVLSSGGTGIVVKDSSIIYWQRWLAENEGIFCEPTSAAAIAGLAALHSSGVVVSGDSVVLPITGSGLKEPPPSLRGDQELSQRV